MSIRQMYIFAPYTEKIRIFLHLRAISFDNRGEFGYNMYEKGRLSRAMWPKGIGVRKVRASQGRITDNDRRRRLQGKCNRNRPPRFGFAKAW